MKSKSWMCLFIRNVNHKSFNSLNCCVYFGQISVESNYVSLTHVELKQGIRAPLLFPICPIGNVALWTAQIYLLLAASWTVPDKVCPSLAKSGVWSRHLTWDQRVRGSVGAVENHTVALQREWERSPPYWTTSSEYTYWGGHGLIFCSPDSNFLCVWIIKVFLLLYHIFVPCILPFGLLIKS